MEGETGAEISPFSLQFPDILMVRFLGLFVVSIERRLPSLRAGIGVLMSGGTNQLAIMNPVPFSKRLERWVFFY